METKRREFLKQSGVCALGAAAVTVSDSQDALGQRNTGPNQKPTLIAVYLRGGADALGTIVPYTDKRLATVRPNLTVPAPDSQAPTRLLPLDETFGLNPSMTALHKLYEAKMCAPIVCVGSPHPTRSHFDAQDFMERAAPGARNVRTGWLNRYLEETRTPSDANLRAFSLQPLLPRSLRGQFPVLARPDQKAELAMAMYSQLYAGQQMPRKKVRGADTQQTIRSFGVRTIQQLSELNAILEQDGKPPIPYPKSRFGRQLRDIARTINAARGLEISALDYGGWDHHINLGPIDGQLANKLGDVSDSIGAFVAEVGPERMKKVLILVMSEFGRTVKENGNQGSDHGHGGFMFAVGGPVNGGKVYGNWKGLEEDKLYQRRDLPVTTDFRLVFAEALRDLYGFDGIKLGMFPQFSPESEPLDYLKKV
jgi:uncharacterized protein (DUF1501 family)